MEAQTTTSSLPSKVFNFNANNEPLEIFIQSNGSPWFVLKDVCDILGLSNPSESIKALDEDEKLTSEILRAGQKREMWLINESGLYNLIFKSTKPQAKVFRKWITSEVIPSIMRKGSYELPVANKYRSPRQLEFIDASNIPYDTLNINDKPVRRIIVDDLTYFSINDIHRAIQANTDATQVAKKLNRKTTLARRILIFGNTHPAWFCTQTGVDLILASSRVLNAQAKQLNVAQS